LLPLDEKTASVIEKAVKDCTIDLPL